MKRYVLSILLTVFALGGVGTYYVSGALAQKPDFRIETTEGDGALFDGLNILGNLYSTNNRYARYLEVSVNGSDYLEDRSLFSPRNLHPLRAELDRKHHAFLRGKNESLVNYYVDEERIIYAEVTTRARDRDTWLVQAEVEMLDLQTGERTTFTELLGEPPRGHWPYLADVQLLDGELHLFVELSGEYRDYVLSAEGELIRTVLAMPELTQPADEDWDAMTREIALSSNHRPHAPKDVVGIQVRSYKHDDALGRVLDRVEQYVFEFKTGNLRLLAESVPELEGVTHFRLSNLMTDDHQYMVWWNKDGLQVDRIHLADGDAGSAYIGVGQLGGEHIRQVSLHGTYVDVLLGDGDAKEPNDYRISVLDLDDGSIAAAGRLSSFATDADKERYGHLSLIGISRR